MKIYLTAIMLLMACVLLAQKSKFPKLKQGLWHSELKLNKTNKLPFELFIEKNASSYRFIVQNAEEKITLNEPVYRNDSLFVRFPYFNSELIFSIENSTAINGYWINYNKGKNYKIPFSAKKQNGNRFDFIDSKSLCNHDYNGRWKVLFEPNTNSSYPAVGVFKQNGNKVSGTFLTETGDYRYLSGNCYDDSLYLSCFDGSHAFLFKSNFKNDSLYGRFFSGTHWSSDWVAVSDNTFELKNPDDLTYVKNESEQVQFTLHNLNGSAFTFPNTDYKNKVVIIQIMGSWCPNCLDETHYYKQLYDKYHKDGLEVISIAYETGKSFEDYVANVNRLKNKLNLDFTFLIGGAANKAQASEHFNMLNEVISFPTSIYIGRDGKVKRVHTGFNGPGTGSYYTEYVQKTNALIESLLAD